MVRFEIIEVEDSFEIDERPYTIFFWKKGLCEEDAYFKAYGFAEDLENPVVGIGETLSKCIGDVIFWMFDVSD